jgi:hypothetical protein
VKPAVASHPAFARQTPGRDEYLAGTFMHGPCPVQKRLERDDMQFTGPEDAGLERFAINIANRDRVFEYRFRLAPTQDVLQTQSSASSPLSSIRRKSAGMRTIFKLSAENAKIAGSLADDAVCCEPLSVNLVNRLTLERWLTTRWLTALVVDKTPTIRT